MLYLSHCVPNPPDKGEKIRAFQEVTYLAARYRLHLACFARHHDEAKAAQELSDRCASVYVEPLPATRALLGAALRFCLGGCLTASFFRSRNMSRHVHSLGQRQPLAATIAYSSAMGNYAPPGVPLLLDMVDVDSEKWAQYAGMRWPGFPYAVESRRLRALEIGLARQAACTLLSTPREMALFRELAGGMTARCLENGVDVGYFDPDRSPRTASLEGRRLLVFIGAMDYFPNRDAVGWFAREVHPHLQRAEPGLEFLIVGRNPARSMAGLAKIPGVSVIGTVPDVRPYLLAAEAVVAPLRLARGIQNKVLEALAMGKPVYASTAVWDSFTDPPPGLVHCRTAGEFVEALRLRDGFRAEAARIRQDACRRFSWEANLAVLESALRMTVASR